MLIRDVRIEDAGRLAQIYSYYVENTAISFEVVSPDEEEFVNRIISISAKYPYLVIEDGGKIMGYAYASTFKARAAYDHCCELSIYLDKDAKKKGYGRALYLAMEDRLKKQGIINLYSCIADPIEEDEYLDRNSEFFHEHMGYKKIGQFHYCGRKYNRWYNMIWMEKFIGEHR